MTVFSLSISLSVLLSYLSVSESSLSLSSPASVSWCLCFFLVSLPFLSTAGADPGDWGPGKLAGYCNKARRTTGRTTGVLLPGGDKDALRSPCQAALILLLKAKVCVRVCEGKERDKEKEKVGLGGTSGWWETDKALKRMFPGVLGKAGHDTLESYLRVFRACRAHTHTHTHTHNVCVRCGGRVPDRPLQLGRKEPGGVATSFFTFIEI